MPKINVYLSDELAEAVKEANLPVSTICQRALEQAVRRVAAVHQSLSTEDLGANFEHVTKFTGRMRVLLTMAVEAARDEGQPVGTEHLLGAILEEGDGLGLRVLRGIEIDADALAAALAARKPAVSPGTGFTAHAQEALRLTAAESTALGHAYIGTEHLLLGLIAEPNGVAGQVLRGAGADLRLTRKAIQAALVGWFAHNEAGSASPTDMMAALQDAVRQQREPIMARLDRLEARA